MLTIDVVSANQLSPEQTEAWSTLQRGTDYLDDPFFSPEFTRAVARVRDHIEVAVLRESGQFVGLLPFERGPRKVQSSPLRSRPLRLFRRARNWALLNLTIQLTTRPHPRVDRTTGAPMGES